MDMSNMKFCQSCAMPLMEEKDMGTNADGGKNQEYCVHCFQNGSYTHECTMDEMIEQCVPFVSNGNPYNSEQEARSAMQGIFPQLKRWQ